MCRGKGCVSLVLRLPCFRVFVFSVLRFSDRSFVLAPIRFESPCFCVFVPFCLRLCAILRLCSCLSSFRLFVVSSFVFSPFPSLVSRVFVFRIFGFGFWSFHFPHCVSSFLCLCVILPSRWNESERSRKGADGVGTERTRIGAESERSGVGTERSLSGVGTERSRNGAESERSRNGAESERSGVGAGSERSGVGAELERSGVG